MEKNQKSITVVNPKLKFDKVSLVEPTTHHYILLAAEVDTSVLPFFLFTSRKKKDLLNRCKTKCREIEKISGVASAVTFTARLIPPGKGKLLKERPQIHVARYDVVVLIETRTETATNTLKSDDHYRQMKQEIIKMAKHSLFLNASNVKKIDSVDHATQGVFLFNFFYADNLEKNINIWEYTAGWFQQETGLDNSTVLLPDNTEDSPYKIINHCRWDRLTDILPSLLFKRSFRPYVLDNFYANGVAAIPILYKLA